MSKEDTQFTESKQPGVRGRSFKNKLLDTIREESLLECSPTTGKERTEQAFLKHLATRAFDTDDNNSATLLKELLSKSYASVKSTLPQFEFDFNAEASPVTQVNQLIAASSRGHIPADVAAIFIQSVKDATTIEVNTELKERIEKLEAMINV